MEEPQNKETHSPYIEGSSHLGDVSLWSLVTVLLSGHDTGEGLSVCACVCMYVHVCVCVHACVCVGTHPSTSGVFFDVADFLLDKSSFLRRKWQIRETEVKNMFQCGMQIP